MKANFKIIVSIFLSLFSFVGLAQRSVPAHFSFDNAKDTIGWSHYSTAGTDDWQVGVPNSLYFTSPRSSPNIWATNLTGKASKNSVYYLETPYFNLADTTREYALSFYHKLVKGVNDQYTLEYIQGASGIWSLLSITAPGFQWQNSNGFNAYINSTYGLVSNSITHLKGNDSLKFRFKVQTGPTTDEGWGFDNFQIDTAFYNFTLGSQDTIVTNQKCGIDSIEFKFRPLRYMGYYQKLISKVYLSEDRVLDSRDTLIFTDTSSVGGFDIKYKINNLKNLNLKAGMNYLLVHLDPDNQIKETNETDNLGFIPLFVDSVFSKAYRNDFELNSKEFTSSISNSKYPNIWEQGTPYVHSNYGTHSGQKAWHTSKLNYDSLHIIYQTVSNLSYFLESPIFDLSSITGKPTLSFWLKSPKKLIGGTSKGLFVVEQQKGCSTTWKQLAVIDESRTNQWSPVNIDLDSLKTEDNVRFRINYIPNRSFNLPGSSIDDFYIGDRLADLSIERTSVPRYYTSNSAIQFKYLLTNAGLASATSSFTHFYWSSDSLLDGSDQYLGRSTEPVLTDTGAVWRNFSFTPSASRKGTYYLIYKLDSGNRVAEMREDNNTGFIKVNLINANSYPYSNRFETNSEGWSSHSSLGPNSWIYGTPGTVFKSNFSDQKAWTSSSSNFSTNSLSYLVSPIFDLTAAKTPILKFDLEFLSGWANLQYTIDGGASWHCVDTVNNSYHRLYYRTTYKTYYNGGLEGERIEPLYYQPLFFDSTNSGNFGLLLNKDYDGKNAQMIERNTVAVPYLKGETRVQFRFRLFDYDRLQTIQGAGSYAAFDKFTSILVDNFELSEGISDLTQFENKLLYHGSNARRISTSFKVVNQGNDVSKPCKMALYLTTDTNGTNKIKIGEVNVAAIRSTRFDYVNVDIALNSIKLAQYKYLYFEIDSKNTNIESNESNNKGYWLLGIDSLKTPYLEDFSDSTLNGWYLSSIDANGKHNEHNSRVRHQFAPNEDKHFKTIKEGSLFTDRINFGGHHNFTPTFYIQSPSFNFSDVDEVSISANLDCFGADGVNGGRMSYSKDGGNTWFSLRVDSTKELYNWYPKWSFLTYFNGDIGWADRATGQDSTLNYRFVDLTNLGGEKAVLFRFEVHSWAGHFQNQGMVLDNFKVEGLTSDYYAKTQNIKLKHQVTEQKINLVYEIGNAGNTNGKRTKTKFYKSLNKTLDPTDQLIYYTLDTGINKGKYITDAINFSYPVGRVNDVYYILYFVDADSSMNETNEFNNIGYFEIEVIDTVNTSTLRHQNLSGVDFKVIGNTIVFNNGQSEPINGTLEIMDLGGKSIFKQPLDLPIGIMQYEITNELSASIYLVSFATKEGRISKKVPIQ